MGSYTTREFIDTFGGLPDRDDRQWAGPDRDQVRDQVRDAQRDALGEHYDRIMAAPDDPRVAEREFDTRGPA